MAVAVTHSEPLVWPPLGETFLPAGGMRQIARITLLDGARIDRYVEVDGAHWVYPSHFPGDPIYPGSLMVEAAGQLVALWAWAQGHRRRPRLVRTAATFHRPVTPTSRVLRLQGEVRGKRHLQFGDRRGGPSGYHGPTGAGGWSSAGD